MKNIFLTGFMGSGKSTIGEYINQKTSLEFIDTDTLIENKIKTSINKIFDTYGEAYFRDIETCILSELCNTESKIISTGGGIITRQENIQIMKENGIVVFIDTPFDSICSRLQDDTTRPLINTDEKFKNMRDLYNARLPIYIACADFIVKGDNSELLANEIINKITFF